MAEIENLLEAFKVFLWPRRKPSWSHIMLIQLHYLRVTAGTLRAET
jgi:hypothetical protein